MKNPWETGETFAGIRLAHCDTQSRMSAARRMSVEQLRECLVWPDTQKSVRTFIERRLRKMGNARPHAEERSDDSVQAKVGDSEVRNVR